MQALARGHMQAHRPAAGGASRASAARVPALPHQPRRLVVANSFRQGSTSITKKRYKFGQGNGLPPVRGGDRGGGGGGGDGWGWERAARNILPNVAFLGLYLFITSHGGDGWGNGPFGGGGGGGDGGGDGWGGGWGDGAPSHGGDGSMLGEDGNEEERGAGGRRVSRHHAEDAVQAPPLAARGAGGGRLSYR